MAYCNQLFSEQMETRAVRTELLTAGNPLHRPKQDFYGFESTTAELSLTLFASKPVENSYRTSSHVAQRAQFLSRFVRNPYSWNTVGEFGRSGLHKLSSSPKLPLVFAPAYVNTARVIYFLNRRKKLQYAGWEVKLPAFPHRREALPTLDIFSFSIFRLGSAKASELFAIHLREHQAKSVWFTNVLLQ